MPPKTVQLIQRKRPTESEIAEIERFAEAKARSIAGEPVTEPSKQATGIIERPGRLRADGSRKGARTLRRVTVYLPPELAKKLTVQSAELDRTLSELVTEAVSAYL